ncbi:MAG TPA: DUF3299 domain-containing protein [Oceanicaulis sp.]|jgi:hypothetical protein|uniref:Lipoprotein n=1 Tax=Glycocaulis albus TaxID=1382801 RepID=A0ABQ1XLC6_9PROT|nr:DUF3299 domain-containing protein [Glycocaulis albus]GGG96943.1 hypothetical protein GCM10007420_10760 [Glycocaulis albus]HCY54206.1 DUF3299 domain-containing protein [Oceanicaulis sp.]
MRKIIPLTLMALLALTACSPAGDSASEQPVADVEGDLLVDPAAEAELLNWRDLLPEGELEMLLALEEGTAPPTLMSQFQTRRDEQMGTFNVVEELDGLVVRMPGYILPLDYAERGQAREFLFLPYHGACIHYPPPPPNQIVYLRSAEPVSFSQLWEPVWVEGRMEIQRVETDLADAAYAMAVRSVRPYDG